ncbi:MAG TPA: inositol monophosphatase family protein [Bacteroidia bacterium]|nr:MAG: inositol monophosphatase/fructose-1,6-bisphosphatase family protein [Bacteroidetes bacterium OLB10]MBE7509039.1 inositol monophosphatase [Bacteroidia bacterium]MBS1763748.1 inositol monophosphatase [Bacteroidota bacterium]OQB65905.1 MAG: Inositol-1-monophosphatase [Bacteroidetes bacterium ADurb.Bin141]MBV6454033.1 Inositol-1-monophosphatase [Bacteroidia bacterium]
MNFGLITKQTCEAAQEASDFIRKESLTFDKSKVEHKGLHDLVSYVDKTSEKILVDRLGKIFPEAGFITEESTVARSDKEYNWIIDPLDGTTNFIHGLPCYCVSIALMSAEKLEIGVVLEINFNECFYGWHKGGAYMNGKRIAVTSTPSLQHTLLATGFPYTDYSHMEEYMKVFDYCMRNTRGIRRLGSAAADLAYTACGRLDGFFEYGLNAWDVAGGALLVKEAGGRVSDFSGQNNFLFGAELVATNFSVYNEFMEVIKKCFNH